MQKTEVEGKTTWTTDSDGGRFTITKLDKEHEEYGKGNKVSLTDKQEEGEVVHYFSNKAEATKHINKKQSETRKAEKAAEKAEGKPSSPDVIDNPDTDDDESEDE